MGEIAAKGSRVAAGLGAQARSLRARVTAALDRRICALSRMLSLTAALLVCATPLLLVYAGSVQQPAEVSALEKPTPAPPIEIIKTRPLTTVAAQPAPAASAPPVTPAPSPVPKTTAPQIVPPVAPPAPDVWSEADITAARKQCGELLGPLGATYQDMPPIKQDKCGTPAPVSLKRLGPAAGGVEFSPPAVLNCAMVAKLSAFVETTLQPAARETFGAPVVRFNSASGFVCRGRNGDMMANGKLSEHAIANALDVASFTLADGRVIDVGKHWGPAVRDFKTPTPGPQVVAPASRPQAPGSERTALGAPPPPPVGKAAHAPPDLAATKTTEALFLRRLHQGACVQFGTVLGPEANEAHREHFHFDLHPRRQSNYCQ